MWSEYRNESETVSWIEDKDIILCTPITNSNICSVRRSIVQLSFYSKNLKTHAHVTSQVLHVQYVIAQLHVHKEVIT